MENIANLPSVQCKDCLFKQMLMEHLSDEEIEIHCNNTPRLQFKKGEPILKQGNSFTHIAYLIYGEIKSTWEYQPGKYVIKQVASYPALLGLHNLQKQDVNMWSVIALKHSVICMIDIEKLTHMMAKNGRLFQSLLRLLSQIPNDIVSNIEYIEHKCLDGKMATVIIYLAHVYRSDSFELNLSRKELGEIGGCSEANASRILKKFKDEGIINYDAKEITIINRTLLEDICRKG